MGRTPESARFPAYTAAHSPNRLPNVSGIYNRRPVWANLFLFVTARASSGKRRLSLCKFIIDPIHDRLREINEAEEMEYEQKMQQYQANKRR